MAFPHEAGTIRQMNYSAKKIFLTCDEKPVRDWAAYMQAHTDEVIQSLSQEQVRHEVWYLGNQDGSLYLIGVLDVDDHALSSAIAQKSLLSVDKVHQQFKAHWDRASIVDLGVAPDRPPAFPGCELLLEARS